MRTGQCEHVPASCDDPYFCLRDSASVQNRCLAPSAPRLAGILGIFLRFLFHKGSGSFNGYSVSVCIMTVPNRFVNRKNWKRYEIRYWKNRIRQKYVYQECIGTLLRTSSIGICLAKPHGRMLRIQQQKAIYIGL